jgi:hypothetical protein
MSVPALAEPTSAATPAITKKKDRISPRIKRAIDLLVTGECKFQKDAAAAVGMTQEHLCRELKKPHIGAFADQRARETIASLKLRATGRLGELIRAASEHVSLDATKHTLAIAGIRPPSDSQVNVNVGVSVGYVIDLSGNGASQHKPAVDVSSSYVATKPEPDQ